MLLVFTLFDKCCSHRVKVILLFWLLGGVNCCFANTNANFIASQLALADQLKVRDPDQSFAILNTLSGRKLSELQKDYHQYLVGFNAAIHSEIPRAINLISPVSERHPADELGMRSRSTLLSLYGGLKDWSKALVVASELESLLESMPRTPQWHLANVGAGNFYLKLAMFDTAFQLLDEAYQSQSQVIDEELRCRYGSQRLAAFIGLATDQVKPAMFNEVQLLCSSLPSSVYTLEFAIIWARYLMDSGHYIEALAKANEFEQAILDLDYFYFRVALQNTKARALVALEHYDKAAAIVDELLGYPNITDYREGFSKAARVKVALASKAQDYASAYNWQLQMAEIERQLQLEEKAKALAVFRAKSMQKAADTALQLLADNQALLREDLRYAEHKLLNLYLTIALVCSLLLVAGFAFYRMRQQKQTWLKLASTDALTGLANRRHFIAHMDNVLRKNRFVAPLSLILCDLDGIKQINDTYGHQAGDWALEQVGLVLREYATENTVCSARIAGDEFVICLESTSAVTAMEYCDQLQQHLAGIDTRAVCGDISLSASFGVCDTDQTGAILTALISGADLAMYQAKKAGRRRAVIYQAHSPDK
ncbi:GGDEF domain-containing protein [Alteromonas lipolytica]|uniref:diguanylate cyclase n=1 Tax=Alteromonas lipolytica TaxID=1856405 RepID=A0A1E8FHR8_9ALTE|nr:GGDEF domain-containing protein [Alteromonas lipolytica]OFI35023.1 hypothetical protein BFC17_15820 [Alteromonas lipolytica]GGF55962.1 GGDEF domain-containing protein [Alteromonas lipolytica]